MNAPASLGPVFDGRSVFVTGHTGFKGAWLSLWLARLGARVTGYGLPPSTTPSLFDLARVRGTLARHIESDVRDLAALTAAMQAAAPEVVFHLAAQALVRRGYRDAPDTWSTNVMGTVNLLEAVRACPSVKAVVVVTTDKCYENREWPWGYREHDALGGSDPYSASKAGAELVVHSYRSSFFAAGGPQLASARAGNVIGGGDWSEDRLLADAARAAVAGTSLLIRHPHATRPWQHVLESLHGYLRLATLLLDGQGRHAEAFNFGPDAADNVSVAELLGRLQPHWPELRWQLDQSGAAVPHEANFLYLDSSKARRQLDWTPTWNLATCLEQTAAWYRAVALRPADARAISERQLDRFCQ
ncbi:CDP-glucose 4,6-dehydratase [Massilia eurypsychrophila]|jgi:CDP-glucose 4,6-dehydratase|uniref:CDP-glucose 4,6-dehydratase n=1 Tax=Massilia eurypsychrophila TaxID=1485217 RepID=A0A2G8TBN6_9BURK|nr:CDP-glucose 4,6-dehydratase [Massilia eurypsychrophila]PIL43389.1 CDP-glucose 4,6-dehydratase [Massilia eurypsychrophila]